MAITQKSTPFWHLSALMDFKLHKYIRLIPFDAIYTMWIWHFQKQDSISEMTLTLIWCPMIDRYTVLSNCDQLCLLSYHDSEIIYHLLVAYGVPVLMLLPQESWAFWKKLVWIYSDRISSWLDKCSILYLVAWKWKGKKHINNWVIVWFSVRQNTWKPSLSWRQVKASELLPDVALFARHFYCFAMPDPLTLRSSMCIFLPSGFGFTLSLRGEIRKQT